MSARRAVEVLHFLIVLAIPPVLCADTLYLTHDEEMQGRILHIERTGEGIEYIRFETLGAIIDVPGNMIARYEDVLEPTDTPTPTLTSTPIPTNTRVPTATFTPYPTPTIRVVAAPREPRPPPREVVQAEPASFEEAQGDWSEDSEFGSEEDWGGNTEEGWGEDNPIGRFNKRLQAISPGVAIPKYFGIALLLAFLQLLLLLAAWILCTVDSFGHGVLQGILMLIFGCPFCCVCLIPFVGPYISPLILIIYSRAGFRGDTKMVVDGLIAGAIIINFILKWLM